VHIQITTPEIQELGTELEKVHKIQEKAPDQERFEGELAVILAGKMAKLPVVQETANYHPQPLHPQDQNRHPMLV